MINFRSLLAMVNSTLDHITMLSSFSSLIEVRRNAPSGQNSYLGVNGCGLRQTKFIRTLVAQVLRAECMLDDEERTRFQ